VLCRAVAVGLAVSDGRWGHRVAADATTFGQPKPSLRTPFDLSHDPYDQRAGPWVASWPGRGRLRVLLDPRDFLRG